MATRYRSTSLTFVLLLVVLISCSTDHSAVSGGGIGGTGVTVGPITGFGSIVVNDVHMDVETATVALDGLEGTKDDLKLGMVVVVRGNFSSDGVAGVATSVEFEDNLEGPVDPSGVDLINNRLTVVGQTVIVNTMTYLEDQNGAPTSLAQIQEGNMVEVSGLPDADGNIVATRIEVKAPAFVQGMEIEIKGTIQNLTNTTFEIGALTVNYDGAEIEPSSSSLSEGLFVEVESEDPPNSGTLTAHKVEVKVSLSDSLGEEGERVEIEGFVTDFSALDQSFRVNGVPVRTTATTEYEHGVPGDITNGVRLEVEGQLGAGGILEALKVEFEDSGESEGDP